MLRLIDRFIEKNPILIATLSGVHPVVLKQPAVLQRPTDGDSPRDGER